MANPQAPEKCLLEVLINQWVDQPIGECDEAIKKVEEVMNSVLKLLVQNAQNIDNTLMRFALVMDLYATKLKNVFQTSKIYAEKARIQIRLFPDERAVQEYLKHFKQTTDMLNSGKKDLLYLQIVVALVVAKFTRG